MSDRIRALAVILAVFVAGCALGGGAVYFWFHRTAAASSRVEQTGPLGGQRLSEYLQLTPDQQARFRQILAESRTQIMSIRREALPRIEAVRADTHRKLAGILNEDQKKKFDQFVQEMAARRERMNRRPWQWWNNGR
jgi:uncharacterized membrane protein